MSFESDCLILDKYRIIYAGLSNDSEIIKGASFVSEMQGVFGTIVNDVKATYEKEGGLGKTLLYFLTPSIIGRFIPFGGIATIILDAFGFDVTGTMTSILKGAWDMVKNLVSTKDIITPEDANNIVNSIGSTASLNALYEIEKQGQIVHIIKNSEFNKTAAPLGFIGDVIKWLFKMGKGVRGVKDLIAGIIKWFVKAVLTGVLGIEGSKAVYKGITGSPATTEKQETQREVFPAPQHHSLRLSGEGTQVHPNTRNTVWIVRLVNNSIPQTLIAWAVRIYPQLVGHENELTQSASFNNIVSIMESNYNHNSPGYLEIIPDPNIHSWKDIVDRFVGETASKIKET